MINTLYGVLASKYFRLGNTVLGDNITARARTSVCTLAKTFNYNQTITDGSTYELQKTFHLNPKDKKPSGHTFADLTKLEKHRAIKLAPLGGIIWNDYIDKFKGNFASAQLDYLAIVHYENFGGAYGTILPYNIEHKEEHLSLKTVYFSKSNYAFLTYDIEKQAWCKIIYKIRGQKPEFDGLQNPYFITFNNILNGVDKIPEVTNYKHFTLLRIGGWKEKKNRP